MPDYSDSLSQSSGPAADQLVQKVREEEILFMPFNILVINYYDYQQEVS